MPPDQFFRCLITTQHNGWGEVVPSEEQALQQGKRAGVACMATTWFETYKKNVLAFIKETGMQGLETDGQYESYACADDSGDHHHNGELLIRIAVSTLRSETSGSAWQCLVVQHIRYTRFI